MMSCISGSTKNSMTKSTQLKTLDHSALNVFAKSLITIVHIVTPIIIAKEKATPYLILLYDIELTIKNIALLTTKNKLH